MNKFAKSACTSPPTPKTKNAPWQQRNINVTSTAKAAKAAKAAKIAHAAKAAKDANATS